MKEATSLGEFMVNCSPTLAAAVGFLTYDTVVNQKMRTISPYASGKDIPINLNKFGFDVSIPVIKIGDEKQPLLMLKPSFNGNVLSYVE